jgi:hypothetical protein
MKIEKFKVLLYLKKSSPDKSGKTPIMGRVTVNNSMSQFSCKLNCKARMLIATDYARKMSLDMRLIDPVKYGDHIDNKASHTAAVIAGYYEKYGAQKGTQFVFSDLGTWKPDVWK